MNWMILPFKRYAEFTGRSRRMEYWMFTLFNLLVMMALVFVAFGAGGAAGLLDASADPGEGAGALFGGLGLLVVIYVLAIFIPSIAVTIRRLHDRDLSGWWYLGAIVAGLVPYVGFIASIAFLVVLALPGTPGSNRFGPDPKGAGEAETFA